MTVGFATADDGIISGYDIPSVQAAEMAIAQLNKSGGVLGHPIKVVSANTDSNINQGRQAGLEVVSKGANVVFTTPDYNYGGGAARVANQDKIPVISAAGSTLFGPSGIGPYAYSTAENVTSEGEADAQWAYADRHYRTAYVLDDTSTDADQQQCAGFTKAYASLGGKIVGSETFENSASSIATQITKLKSGPAPQFVLLCSYPPGGATAVQQLRAAGVNVPILGEQAFDGTSWYAKSMPRLTNFFYLAATSRYGDDPSKSVNAFWRQFKAKYGNPPSGFPVQYYAAMMAVASAIKAAGTTSGPAVIAQMNKLHVTDLLAVSFTPQTHILSLRMRVIQIKNGKPSYLQTTQPGS